MKTNSPARQNLRKTVSRSLRSQGVKIRSFVLESKIPAFGIPSNSPLKPYSRQERVELFKSICKRPSFWFYSHFHLSEDNFQATTLLGCVVLREDVYQQFSDTEVRVQSHFCVGSSGLKLLARPFVVWALKRKFRSEQQSRARKTGRWAQLLQWGYHLAPATSPQLSRGKAKGILPNRVVPPTSPQVPQPASFSLGGSQQSPYFYGNSDHFGLRIEVDRNSISLHPRLCAHEGASLDNSACQKNRIKCPWHGRVFKPLIRIPRSEVLPFHSLPHHNISYDGRCLTIEAILPDTLPRPKASKTKVLAN